MESLNGTVIMRSSDLCDTEDILCVLLYIFLVLLTAITIGGNLLVITSISYFKQLHTPTNYLILSLAVADLLMGVLVFPYNVAFSYTSCFFVNTLNCKIRSTFDFALSVSSILSLCCISVDRYYAVCQPLMYKAKMTENVALIMCLGNWSSSIALGIFFISMAFYYDACVGECFLVLFVTTVFTFYIPIILLLLMNFKILFVAKRQARSVESKTLHSGPTASKERKANKTMAIVMGVFLLCWMPLFVTHPFQNMDNVLIILMEPFNWLALSNSMFNPFIYAFFFSWFRSAVRMILSGKIFQGDCSHAKLH